MRIGDKVVLDKMDTMFFYDRFDEVWKTTDYSKYYELFEDWDRKVYTIIDKGKRPTSGDTMYLLEAEDGCMIEVEDTKTFPALEGEDDEDVYIKTIRRNYEKTYANPSSRRLLYTASGKLFPVHDIMYDKRKYVEYLGVRIPVLIKYYYLIGECAFSGIPYLLHTVIEYNGEERKVPEGARIVSWEEIPDIFKDNKFEV